MLSPPPPHTPHTPVLWRSCMPPHHYNRRSLIVSHASGANPRPAPAAAPPSSLDPSPVVILTRRPEIALGVAARRAALEALRLAGKDVGTTTGALPISTLHLGRACTGPRSLEGVAAATKGAAVPPATPAALTRPVAAEAGAGIPGGVPRGRDPVGAVHVSARRPAAGAAIPSARFVANRVEPGPPAAGVGRAPHGGIGRGALPISLPLPIGAEAEPPHALAACVLKMYT
eukprot:scaffold26766_cov96-Isochrysis_galbana.AAC.2